MKKELLIKFLFIIRFKFLDQKINTEIISDSLISQGLNAITAFNSAIFLIFTGISLA